MEKGSATRANAVAAIRKLKASFEDAEPAHLSAGEGSALFQLLTTLSLAPRGAEMPGWFQDITKARL